MLTVDRPGGAPVVSRWIYLFRSRFPDAVKPEWNPLGQCDRRHRFATEVRCVQDHEIAADGERERLQALAARFSAEDLMRAFDVLT